jgi:hypothetical protein
MKGYPVSTRSGNVQPLAFNVQRSTFNVQRLAFNVRRSPFAVRRVQGAGRSQDGAFVLGSNEIKKTSTLAQNAKHAW